ncbi:hypothetical protein FXO37_00385 [Capsicum annuum]|nr:hypothetical protein FXO37_00385 [Capsicum annuum]
MTVMMMSQRMGYSSSAAIGGPMVCGRGDKRTKKGKRFKGENNAQGLADCYSDGEDSDVQLDMPVAEETETEGFWHWMALQEMDVNRFRVKTEEHRLCQSMRCKDWRPC